MQSACQSLFLSLPSLPLIAAMTQTLSTSLTLQVESELETYSIKGNGTCLHSNLPGVTRSSTQAISRSSSASSNYPSTTRAPKGRPSKCLPVTLFQKLRQNRRRKRRSCRTVRFKSRFMKNIIITDDFCLRSCILTRSCESTGMFFKSLHVYELGGPGFEVALPFASAGFSEEAGMILTASEQALTSFSQVHSQGYQVCSPSLKVSYAYPTLRLYG